MENNTNTNYSLAVDSASAGSVVECPHAKRLREWIEKEKSENGLVSMSITVSHPDDKPQNA